MDQYFLYIERFAQNSYSGDPETSVAPDKIDYEKNLHVYLTGNIAGNRSVLLRAMRQTISATPTNTSNRPTASARQQTYKASLPHYSLSQASDYLLKAVDDDGDPWAIASHEIRTL